MKDIFSVKAKLGLSFGLLLLLVLIISAISIISLGDSNGRFSSYINGISKRKELSSELLLAAQQRAISARNLVLINSSTVRADEKKTLWIMPTNKLVNYYAS